MPEENNFNRKSIEELIQFMERNKGHFAFLIGAGTSKAADIPTSKELIEEWQKEKYKREGGNLRNKKPTGYQVETHGTSHLSLSQKYSDVMLR